MVQTNWTSLGRPPAVNWGSSPSVARTIDGRLEVFVLDSSGALWHIQQTTPGMNWNSWASLSIAPNTNVLPGLVVERNADGRLEIFALDSAGALWHTWQTSPGGGWFHWFSSGSPPGVTTDGPLTVAQNADGRLEVFAIAESRSLWHIWQFLLWQGMPMAAWRPFCLTPTRSSGISGK